MHSVSANGAEIPALGLGTWTLKGPSLPSLIAKAVEAGYRHIDTAAMYGNESEIGDGIRQCGLDRNELFVTTKVWHTDLADGALQKSAASSLSRLGLDVVDLLLIHWPPTDGTSIEEAIGALNDAKAQGMARHIGISNFPVAYIERAARASEHPLACNQCEYHPMLDQDVVLAACREHGMTFTSYCPLGRGGEIFSSPAVSDAAAAHGRTPAQIVLRWHVQQQSVAAIPRSSNPDHVAANFQIWDFELDDAQMQAISALRSRNHRICDFDFSPDWD